MSHWRFQAILKMGWSLRDSHYHQKWVVHTIPKLEYSFWLYHFIHHQAVVRSFQVVEYGEAFSHIVTVNWQSTIFTSTYPFFLVQVHSGIRINNPYEYLLQYPYDFRGKISVGRAPAKQVWKIRPLAGVLMRPALHVSWVRKLPSLTRYQVYPGIW